MGALTPTKVAKTELAGDLSLYVCTITPASASDTVTFVAATHKFRKIYAVLAEIESGADANLLTVQPSFSGLVVTVVTKGADGLAATDWTGASIRLVLVVGSAD